MKNTSFLKDVKLNGFVGKRVLRSSVIKFPFITKNYISDDYSEEAKDYFARLVAAGSDMTVANKAAWNEFIVGCKVDGTWAKMSEAYGLAGPNDLVGTSVKVKYVTTSTTTWINFVSGDYNRVTGLKGDGSGKSGQMNFDASLHLSTANIHLASEGSDIPTSGPAENNFIGCALTPGILRNGASTNIEYYYGAVRCSFPAVSSGFIVGVGESASVSRLYLDGILQASGANASGAAGTNTRMFGRGNFTVIGHSPARLRFGSVGTGLTGTDVANLNTRLATLMAALS